MNDKKRKLIIVGDSSFAEIAFEYFTHDSEYEVVAFAVESQFRQRSELFGIPVVDFETIQSIFAPKDHYVFTALTYAKLNRIRTRLYLDAKAKGYGIASYVSSRAFCWRNITIGENVFIFEDNTIQPFVTIGNNVIMWSGNHIGHHSTIKDNCFISSHVVISGHCEVGENCFIGVNATIANNLTIARDTFIAMSAAITKSTEENKVYKASPATVASVDAKTLWKVDE
jgi:sugar O-acyltransferase (sialic acid O-acetyltransferase NeuD family)